MRFLLQDTFSIWVCEGYLAFGSTRVNVRSSASGSFLRAQLGLPRRHLYSTVVLKAPQHLPKTLYKPTKRGSP